MTPVGKNSILVLTFSLCLKIFFQHEGDASYVDPPLCFTAVSVRVSIRIRSHPKAPPA